MRTMIGIAGASLALLGLTIASTNAFAATWFGQDVKLAKTAAYEVTPGRTGYPGSLVITQLKKVQVYKDSFGRQIKLTWKTLDNNVKLVGDGRGNVVPEVGGVMLKGRVIGLGQTEYKVPSHGQVPDPTFPPIGGPIGKIGKGRRGNQVPDPTFPPIGGPDVPDPTFPPLGR